MNAPKARLAADLFRDAMLTTTAQTKMDEIMQRIRAGEKAAIDEAVELFNARPMRREDDLRIQGWRVIQS